MILLLRLLWQKNKRLLLSFLCMTLVTAAAMLFVFAKIEASAYAVNSYNLSQCTFMLRPAGGDHLSVLQSYVSLMHMLEECEIRPDHVQFSLPVNREDHSDHLPIYVLPCSENDILREYEIPADEWDGAMLYAASPFAREQSVHDGMVTVCGHDLRVAAMKYPDEIGFSVVSLRAALLYDLPIERIDMIYPLLDDRKALAAQYDVLNLYWYDASISKPVERDYNLEEQAQSDGYLADAVFLLIVFAALYLYSVLMNTIRGECCIFRMLGMSKMQLLYSMLLLTICVSGISVAAAAGIYHLILYPILLLFEPVFRYVDAAAAYRRTALISVGQAVLLCIANLLFMSKLNIVKMIKENRT